MTMQTGPRYPWASAENWTTDPDAARRRADEYMEAGNISIRVARLGQIGMTAAEQFMIENERLVGGKEVLVQDATTRTWQTVKNNKSQNGA